MHTEPKVLDPLFDEIVEAPGGRLCEPLAREIFARVVARELAFARVGTFARVAQTQTN